VEQARLFAPDLAAENERAVELVAVLLEILGVALVDVAQGIAHDARGAEHVGGAEDGRGLRGILGRLAKQIDHRLGDREIARRQQHQRAVVQPLERRHLAERIDLIDAGVGPRIGQHHETGVDQQADAVSHGAKFYSSRRNRAVYCCWLADSATSTLASIFSPPPPWRTPRTGAASK
jgi:hypothetical protein